MPKVLMPNITVDSTRFSFISEVTQSWHFVLNNNSPFCLDRRTYMVVYSCWDAGGAFAGSGVYLAHSNLNKQFTVEEIYRTSSGVTVDASNDKNKVEVYKNIAFWRMIRGRVYLMG